MTYFSFGCRPLHLPIPPRRGSTTEERRATARRRARDDARHPPARGWHDLSLRAQGLVVFAVPVLGLVSAAVLVGGRRRDRQPVRPLARDPRPCSAWPSCSAPPPRSPSLQNLARRVNHLQANAERLARDADAGACSGRGTDELAAGRDHPGPGGRGAGQPRSASWRRPRASLEHLVSAGADGDVRRRARPPASTSPSPLTARLHQLQQRPGHGPLAGRPAPNDPADLPRARPPRRPGAAARRRAAGPSATPAARCSRRVPGPSPRRLVAVDGRHGPGPRDRSRLRILGYAVDITARRQAEPAQPRERVAAQRLPRQLLRAHLAQGPLRPLPVRQPGASAELLGVGDAGIAGTDDFNHWPDVRPDAAGPRPAGAGHAASRCSSRRSSTCPTAPTRSCR